MVLVNFMVLFENIIMISYRPLWNTMKNKQITKYKLIKEYGFSNGTIDRLRANEHISTYTLEKLCVILECTPMDILEFVPAPTSSKNKRKKSC